MTKKILLISLIAALIFVAVPTLANKDATTTLDSDASLKTAIETRDATIITAVDKFDAAIINALSIRKITLKLAWDKTDKGERSTATKGALTTYKIAARESRQALRAEKKDDNSTENADTNA